MILADTSIWIDHFKMPNLTLSRAILDERLYMHEFVVGELALGSLRHRPKTLVQLAKFTDAPIARHTQVLDLIERVPLHSRGLGYVDAHLLASCLLAGNCKLLTRDRRLYDVASDLGIAA
jgi:predicted nucleic acid-binding protein